MLTLFSATVINTVAKTIVYDMETKNDNVTSIVYLLSRHALLAQMISGCCRSFRTRPLARCQQCKLCAEELRVPSKSFKRCSRCSAELGCDVYYCSQYVR